MDVWGEMGGHVLTHHLACLTPTPRVLVVQPEGHLTPISNLGIVCKEVRLNDLKAATLISLSADMELEVSSRVLRG